MVIFGAIGIGLLRKRGARVAGASFELVARLQMECKDAFVGVDIQVARGFSGCFVLRPEGWKGWMVRNEVRKSPREKSIELRHYVQALTSVGEKPGCKHHRECLKPRVENMMRLPNRMASEG